MRMSYWNTALSSDAGRFDVSNFFSINTDLLNSRFCNGINKNTMFK